MDRVLPLEPRNRTKSTSVLLVVVGLALGVVTVDVRLTLGFVLFAGLCGWLWLVHRSHVTAFAVFFALTPVWQYLKFMQYPAISVVGTNSHLPTVVKEVLLLILFCHWFFTQGRKRNSRIPAPKMLLAFFGLLVVMLFVASPPRFIFLLRPYVEMFVLVAVPLFALDLSSRDVEKLLLGFLIAGTIFSTIALYQFFVDPTFLFEGYLRPAVWDGQRASEGTAFYGGRLQSITANPNNLGMLSLFTSILALRYVKMKGATWQQRVIATVIFGMAALVVFLARSRDDVALLMLGVGLFALLTRNFRIAMLGGAGILASLAYRWHQITTVFTRLIKNGNPRIEIWFRAFDLYWWKLFVGGSTSTSLGLLDSTYLLLLIHVGVLGTGLFLLLNGRLIFWLLFHGVRLRNNVMITIGIILFAFMGNLAVSTAFYDYPFTTYYWALFALGTVITLEEVSSGTS